MARLSLTILLSALLLAALAPAQAAPASRKVQLRMVGSTAIPAAEQVAYDETAKVAYVIGGTTLSVVNLDPALLAGGSGPAGATLPVLTKVDVGKSLNDVIFCGQYLALAISGAAKTDPGTVQLHLRYSASKPRASLRLLASFTVGALPDQIEFSKDCQTILVSNEGEPDGYGSASFKDPEGSVSIIKLKTSNGGAKVTGSVCTADFKAWNDKKDLLLSQNIKINGPGSTVAQDLEPEFTTFSHDEKTAFVTLQENNAIATVDVASCKVTGIHALGLKNHARAINKMDASDKDGAINITTWPVFGMYMPDEIKSFRVGGVDYVVSANEGDAREYEGFAEEGEVTAAALDPASFPASTAAYLETESALGRLTIVGDKSKINDADGNGLFNRILAYGARSFSIWRLDRGAKRTKLTQVYDSGSLLETLSAKLLPDLFNSDGISENKDKRSDNKGPEPEGVAVGPCSTASSSRLCLFLTTERLGAVFVFDITDPRAPSFQSLALPPQSNTTDESTRFRGPEGITYASYTDANKKRVTLVLVAYEGVDDAASGLGVYRLA